MYNEESLVEEYCNVTLNVLKEVSEKYSYEIILVNDGSIDNTLQIMNSIKEKNTKEISIINLSRNFGLEGAVYAGLSKAKGDIIVTMDADLQDPPNLILEMLKEFEKGYDIISGKRIKRKHDNFFKRFTADMFYKIFQSFSGKVKLERNVSFYRLFSRKVLEKLLELPETNVIFRVTMPFIGMKNTIIGYERDKRFSGKTKYNITSLIKYAIDAITGISVEPLRKIFILVPLIIILLAGSIIGIIILKNLWQIICVFTTVILFLAALNFIVLSIIAEYIAQIMIEVKHRPVSIIYDYIPSENSILREKE